MSQLKVYAITIAASVVFLVGMLWLFTLLKAAL